MRNTLARNTLVRHTLEKLACTACTMTSAWTLKALAVLTCIGIDSHPASYALNSFPCQATNNDCNFCHEDGFLLPNHAHCAAEHAVKGVQA